MSARRVSGVLLDGESLITARALVRVAVQALRDRDAVATLSPAVIELEQLLSRAVADLRSDDEPAMSPPRPQGHGDAPDGFDRPESLVGVPSDSSGRSQEVARWSFPDLTTSEAAGVLGCSTRQVRRLRVELGGVYRGKDLRFDRPTVEAYAEARERN